MFSLFKKITFVIVSLFLAQISYALEIKQDNYNIYLGDVDGDGDSDYYFAQKPWTLILHGEIATPLLLKGTKNFVVYNNAGALGTPQSYTMSDTDIQNKLNSGVFRLAVFNQDVTVLSSSSGEVTTYISGYNSSTPKLILKSASNADIPTLIASDTILPAPFQYDNNSIGAFPNFSPSSYVAITKGAANVSSGTASYQIGLVLPPAIANMVPQLSLVYSSQAGNGSMGIGWGLEGLPSISRCSTSYAIEGAAKVAASNPAYTQSDRLCLSGQQLIIYNNKTPTDAQYWASGTEFRTEIDSFARIIGYGTSSYGGFDYFKVITKEGKTLTFGGDDYAQNTKVFSTFNNTNRIASWALSKAEDNYGNFYTVNYFQDTTKNEHYPVSISYAPNSSVVFTYQNRSGQSLSGYDTGALSVSSKLLDSITTYINVSSPSSPESGTPVRRYDVDYALGTSQLDLVDKITECGYENFNWKCAKPLQLSWSSGEFGFTEEQSVSLCSGGVFSGNNYVDIDGDGFNDSITDNGSAIAWGTPQGCFNKSVLNISGTAGQGGIVSAQEFQTASGIGLLRVHSLAGTNGNATFTVEVVTNINKSNSTASVTVVDTYYRGGVVVSDFNNDSLSDFRFGNSTYTQVSANTFTKTGLPTTLSYFGSGETYAASVYERDIDSDGLVDHISTFWRQTNPSNPATFSNWVASKVFSFSGNNARPFLLTSSCGGIYDSVNEYNTLADINGDGVLDFLVYRQNWKYILGTGKSVENEVDTGFAAFPVEINKRSIAYDYDKDGRDDLIVPLSVGCAAKVLYARDNNGVINFVDSGISIPQLGEKLCNPTSSSDYSLPGDINNDGLIDLVVSGKTYFARKGQPNMLVGVTDGLGAQVKFTYSNMTGELNNGTPLYTPSSAPAFPIVQAGPLTQVVKKMEVSNGKGGFNTRYYNYAGAKVDVRGRGALGFEKITTTDVDSGLQSITEYHQAYPYIGKVKSDTVKQINGMLVSRTDKYYTTRNTGNAAIFPTVNLTVDKTYDLLTSDLNSPVNVSSTEILVHNNCGDPTQVITKVGKGFSGTSVTGELSRQEVVTDYNSFSNCSDSFAVKTTSTVTDVLTGEQKQFISEYQPNNKNDLQMQTDLKGTAKETVTSYGRETNGSINSVTVTAKDHDGITSLPARVAIARNFVKGLYPATKVNAAGHVTTVEYDERFGVEKVSRFGNQQIRSENVYDAFGSVSASIDNDGSRQDIYSFYCSSNPPVTCPAGAVYGQAVVSTNPAMLNYFGQPPVIVFYDQIGREIRRLVYGFDGKVINTAIEYNNNGTLARTSDPYVTNGIESSLPSSIKWTNYSNYDALGRAESVTRSDGGSTQINRALDTLGIKSTVTERVIKSGSIEHQITKRYVNAVGQVVRSEDALFNYVDYTYDAVGNLKSTIVNNDPKTRISIDYDIAGNKIYLNDPGAKVLNYSFNGFGELRRQVWQQGTASQKQMVFDYDLLGRVTQRVDTLANGTNTVNNWVWDTRQAGQLTSRSTNGYLDNFYYDGKSRVSRRVTDITGLSNQTFIYTYDAFSRLKTETFPNGFVAEHSYHALGFRSQIKDISNNEIHKTLWTLGNLLDERGNLTHSLYGNGVITKLTFSSANGRIEKIQSGKLSSSNTYNNFYSNVQDLTYGFDSLGNLLQRRSERAVVNGNPVESLKEDFTYDSLNRLKTTVTRYGGWLDFSGQETAEAFYDNLGNITRKTRYATGSSTNTDLGDFAYAQTGNAGPHAVTSAGGKNYVYDAYGNMVQRGSETLEYSVFNKPTRISGSSTTYLTYGPDHELYKEVNGSKTTYKLGNYDVEVVGTQSVQKSYVGDNIIHSRTFNANVLTDNTYFYVHMDYLGSLESTTDANGNLINRASFDAWGNRRQSNWSSGAPSDNFVTQTGFTGHHQMDAHNLIHMGGRVYDPALGRFLSADVFVQSPFNTQSFNRYSYVFNNPLSLNDPSGYCSGGPDWFSNYMMNKMVEMVESHHISGVMDHLISQAGGYREMMRRNNATRGGGGERKKDGEVRAEAVAEIEKVLEGTGLTLSQDSSSIVDSSGKTVASVTLDLASGTVNVNSYGNSDARLLNAPIEKMAKGSDISFNKDGHPNGCMSAVWTCSSEWVNGSGNVDSELIITARPSTFGNMINSIDLLLSINPFKLGTKGLIKQFRKSFIDCLRCFAAGTEILTEDGFKPIETLKVGDLVWAHDPETGETALKPIVNTVVNTKDSLWELELEKEGKNYLHEVTASHPYYVLGQGWVEVGNLQVGQLIETKDGKPAKVKSLKDTGVVTTTYNFEVKDINTYYVSAAMVLVHNNCGNVVEYAVQNLSWGKNATGHLVKHADVIGFGSKSSQELQKLVPQMKDAVKSLLAGADPKLTKVGKWHGEDAIMFISNGKMVVTKSNGEFLTMIGKTSNKWYEKAKSL